jgi:hypothetical protein
LALRVILLHRGDHQVALFIKLDADVLNILISELSHQRFKLESLGRTVGVAVICCGVLLPVAWSIKDVEDLLSGARSPVLVEAFPLPTDHILREIASASCLDPGNKSFERANIVCELMNGKPFCITMVAVSHEADSDLEISVCAVYNILNYLLKSGFGSLDPAAHGASAVEEETDLE